MVVERQRLFEFQPAHDGEGKSVTERICLIPMSLQKFQCCGLVLMRNRFYADNRIAKKILQNLFALGPFTRKISMNFADHRQGGHKMTALPEKLAHYLAGEPVAGFMLIAIGDPVRSVDKQ